MRFFRVISAAFITIGLFNAVPGMAQEKVKLTLGKAVEMALDHNTTVVQARNSIDAASAASLAAVGGFLPSVSFSASANQSQNWSPETGRVIPLADGSVITSTTGGYSNTFNYYSQLQGNITLFNGFANTANLSRARSNASATEYQSSRADQGAILQTNSLYLNIVRTFQLMKVSEDNLKRSRQQLDRIVESNKVGAVAVADVYRQQVQVGSDELALIQAQANFEKAKVDLVAYLGAESGSDYEFDFAGIPTDIDTTEYQALNQSYSNFGSLVSTALTQRPDYLASVESKNSSDASVTSATAGYFPTVSAYANYQWQSPDVFVFNRFGDNRGLGLGLQFTLPIFNGFSTNSQVQQAKVNQRNAEETVNQYQRQVQVDVRKALLDLESAEKQVVVSQTTVKSAEMDRTIAEEKYNLGAGTLLDLLVATANYTSAVNNKVNAVTGYLLAKKGVEYALGTISH